MIGKFQRLAIESFEKMRLDVAVESPLHRLQKGLKIAASHPTAHGGLIGQIFRTGFVGPVVGIACPDGRPIVKRCPEMDTHDQSGTMCVAWIEFELSLHIADRLRQLGPKFQFHVCSFVVERASWTGTARSAIGYSDRA